MGSIGPMTVIAMSRTEIDRMSVLHDLADGRIRIAEASTLMGAAEKLADLHDIHLARETVRQWMITAGLWKDRRAPLKPVHQPRDRRDCLGELIQIDGSGHLWVEAPGAQSTPLRFLYDAPNPPIPLSIFWSGKNLA